MVSYVNLINDLANELRVETKERGDWLDFSKCPNCGVKNFQCGFNRTTGAFNCFHCGAGHIKDFKELPKESTKILPIKKAFGRPIKKVEVFNKNIIEETSSNYKKYEIFENPSTEIFKNDEIQSNMYMSYEYKLNGQLIAVKHRYYKPDGSKGQFMDAEYETSPKIFYNHDVLKEIKEVYLVEGEKDVETLTKYGFPAITKPFGAKQKWANWMTEALQHIDKIIGCYDNDEAGKEGTLIAARELKDKFVTIHWKDGTPNKYDVTDMINDKGIEGFKELVKKAVPVKLPGHIENEEDIYYWYPGDNETLKYTITAIDERREGLAGLVTVSVKTKTDWEIMGKDKINFWSYPHRQRLFKITGIDPHQIDVHLSEFETAYKRQQQELLAGITKIEVYKMTPEEEEQATEFLKNPRLFYKILEDINTIGYVGEVTNKILLYLIAISRKMETPLGTVVKGPSAGGKSEGVNVVKTLCPPEDVKGFSRLTPQALYHLPKDSLKHKWIIIYETEGADDASYSIRTLLSEKELTLAIPVKNERTGKFTTAETLVEGPIAYTETTTRPVIHNENATRLFDLYIDDSEAQTSKIHELQRRLATVEAIAEKDRYKQEIIKIHRNAQRLLEPVVINIPYAEHLTFPIKWIRTRRDNERFLNLIRVIAFLYQKQRERFTHEAGFTYINATIEDYAFAYKLAKQIFAQTLDEVGLKGREILGKVKRYLEDKAIKQFTTREVIKLTNWSMRYIYNIISHLESLGAIEVVQQKGTQRVYKVVEEETEVDIKGLITPEELKRKYF